MQDTFCIYLPWLFHFSQCTCRLCWCSKARLVEPAGSHWTWLYEWPYMTGQRTPQRSPVWAGDCRQGEVTHTTSTISVKCIYYVHELFHNGWNMTSDAPMQGSWNRRVLDEIGGRMVIGLLFLNYGSFHYHSLVISPHLLVRMSAIFRSWAIVRNSLITATKHGLQFLPQRPNCTCVEITAHVCIVCSPQWHRIYEPLCLVACLSCHSQRHHQPRLPETPSIADPIVYSCVSSILVRTCMAAILHFCRATQHLSLRALSSLRCGCYRAEWVWSPRHFAVEERQGGVGWACLKEALT